VSPYLGDLVTWLVYAHATNLDSRSYFKLSPHTPKQLVLSNKSYVGSSTATDRGSHAGQVKGDDTLVLQVGGWADNPTL
jgi:hypothetical protein